MRARGDGESFERSGTSESDALVAVAIQFFVNGAVVAAYVPRLPEIRDRVGVTVSAVGLLIGIAGVFGLFGSAIVSSVVERYGTKAVLVAGSLAQVAALPVVGFARHPGALLVGLAGVYLFDVLVDVAMNLQGSYLSGRRSRPVMNRLHGLWSIGALVGGVASYQLARSGVSVPAQSVLFALFLVAAVVVTFRRLLPGDIVTGEVDATTSPRRKPLLGLLVLFGLAGATAVTLETVAGEWSAFRLTDDLGSAGAAAAVGYVAFSTGMVVGRLGGDLAASRMGVSNLGSLAGGATLAGLIGATAFRSYALTVLAYLIVGLGVATLIPRLYDSAARTAGRRGAGLGALTAGIRLGGLAAPALVGSLAGTSMSVGAAVAVVTLPSAVGFLLIARRLR